MHNLKIAAQTGNDVYTHIDFEETDAIMQDEAMVKDAFCIYTDLTTGKHEILNEGYPVDYVLSDSETRQLDEFLKHNVSVAK